MSRAALLRYCVLKAESCVSSEMEMVLVGAELPSSPTLLPLAGEGSAKLNLLRK